MTTEVLMPGSQVIDKRAGANNRVGTIVIINHRVSEAYISWNLDPAKCEWVRGDCIALVPPNGLDIILNQLK